MKPGFLVVALLVILGWVILLSFWALSPQGLKGTMQLIDSTERIIRDARATGTFHSYQVFKPEALTEDEVAGRVRMARCGAYTMCFLVPTWSRLETPYNIIVTIVCGPILAYLFWSLHLRLEAKPSQTMHDGD